MGIMKSSSASRLYIATFYTHYGAQEFHRRQLKKDSSAHMMPVPRALSASCGICVAFEEEDTDSIRESNPEDLEGLYRYENNQFVTLYELEEE